MQFGTCLSHILQKIWEANPADAPVWLFKWGISDTFHRCNLLPSDIRKFTYVVPPLLVDPNVLICIELVIPMGWVNSPELFCSTSETVANNSDGYALDPSPYFFVYPPTAGAYKTADADTASSGRLQYVDVYIDDLLCFAQGDPTQQQWVSEITIRSLKEIFPSFPDEVKGSDILEKALAGDEDWDMVKDILGWVIHTHRGILDLSSKQRLEILYLLEIPPTQQ